MSIEPKEILLLLLTTMGMAMDGKSIQIRKQIEDLYDVAPKDLDPENEVAGDDSEGDQGGEDEGRRAHYVDVG